MRYIVNLQVYKSPNLMTLKLSDGRYLRATPDQLPKHLKVGDTGVMVQPNQQQRPRFIPDAIDIDYTSV